MCGLAGYVSYKGGAGHSIDKMLESIKHRGPDARASKSFKILDHKIVLGHVRLSILDLSENANQPMVDYTERFTIVYNGEIYNFAEIKKQLKSKYKFKTDSDTEVILYAFIEWGSKCVKRFVGMFSIVIFDNIKLRLTFLNDRLGVKPLYFYQGKNFLSFASEIKALMTYSYFDKSINPSALTQFMQFGYIQPPLTIFSSVNKIEPGMILEYDISNQLMKYEKYWDVLDILKEYRNNTSNVDQLETYLETACTLRLTSDVPVCTFLSGGVDSALVTSVLAKTTQVCTISLGVEDTRYDEAPSAKETAANIGTEHIETYIREEEIKDLIRKLPYYYDEPFSDTSMFPTFLLSQFASERFKVALSADGGDEAFCGYYRYTFFNKWYWVHFLPTTLKRVFKFLIRNLTNLVGTRYFKLQLLSIKLTKICNILDSKSESQVYKNLNKYVSDERVTKILRHPSIDEGYFTELDSLIMDKNLHRLQAAMLIDYKTYVYQILTKVDRASMANSLEVREPLLDHKLIEFCAALDIKEKFRNGKTKVALRRILKKFVNSNIMTKGKKGFSIPMDIWLKNDLRDLVDEVTSEKAIQESAVFNLKEVSNIKDNFYKNGSSYIELWHLVVFQLWFSRWCSVK